MEKNYKTAAIVLAGGKGSRMGTDIPKQYIEINGKPLLYYTLKAFEESMTDEIVIAVADEYKSYVQEEIVKRYGFNKVTALVTGGNERYDSVYNALKAIKYADYVAIHDGARPFVTPKVIAASFEQAYIYKGAVAGVPSKDTVKICDEQGFCMETPNRKNVWIIQTPQTFEYSLILDAYKRQQECDDRLVTDDAMVVEKYSDVKVKVFEGDYKNIKITTKEDLEVAKMWCL